MRKKLLSIMFVKLSIFQGLCFIWVGMDYFFDFQITFNGFDRVFIFLLFIVFTVVSYAEIFSVVKKYKEDTEDRKAVDDFNTSIEISKELPEDQWCDTDAKADVLDNPQPVFPDFYLTKISFLLYNGISIYCTPFQDLCRVSLVYKKQEIYAFADSDISVCLDRVVSLDPAYLMRCRELIDAGEFKDWVTVFNSVL